MASKYWIKLYHEILHDPKMGKLPDKLWRRVIELFLLAGEFDQDGALPSIEEIAWTLRISEEECNETLQQLQRLNVAHCNDDETWVITNFADRQDASTSTERSKAHRERKRHEKQLEPLRNAQNDATETQRNVAPDTDTDTDKESSSNEEGGKSPPIDEPLPEMPTEPEAEPQPESARPNRKEYPAVKVFVEVTGRYVLNNTQMDEIHRKVGHDPPNLEKWRKTVTAWQLQGNKINGIKGMLEWYENGIPTYGKNNATQNGANYGQKRTQQPNQPNSRDDPPEGVGPDAWANIKAAFGT